MVWPVPPIKALLMPSQTASSRSDCSIMTRPGRALPATRIRRRKSTLCAGHRGTATSQAANCRSRRRGPPIQTAAPGPPVRESGRPVPPRRRYMRQPRQGAPAPASSARASASDAGWALMATLSASPKGNGATSSHPRSSAAWAASWSVPSASRQCRRVGAITPEPGDAGSAVTAAAIKSRICASTASIRGRCAVKAALSCRCPVTPRHSRRARREGARGRVRAPLPSCPAQLQRRIPPHFAKSRVHVLRSPPERTPGYSPFRCRPGLRTARPRAAGGSRHRPPHDAQLLQKQSPVFQ